MKYKQTFWKLNDMNLQQVTTSVWAITDGSTAGNVGCIRLQDRIIVVDTTISPVAAAKFRQLIEKHVGTKITDVVLTHIHSDHTFGVQEFSGCRLISSADMAAMYPKLLKDRWSKMAMKTLLANLARVNPERARELKTLTIVEPTVTFEHSMTLGDNEEVLVQHTGGHTSGQSVVYFAPDQVLFASDLIFCQEYPYAGDPTNDPHKWMFAFENILEMPIMKIIPGHGPVCDKKEVQRHLQYFKELEAWILAKIREEPDVEVVVQQAAQSPPPPYEENVERPSFGEGRLKGTIRRWYEYYKGLSD